MPALVLQLTNAGVAAVTAPDGTERTVIAELGLTAQPFFSAPTLTALPGEFKRLDILSGTAAAPNVAHVTSYDTSADVWNASGFGLYLEDGTLFGTYGSDTTVLSKAGVAFALMAFDITFNVDLLAEISFGDATFIWPPATETTRGIARVGTQAEVDAGNDGTAIVTPKTLGARLTALLTGINTSIVAMGGSLSDTAGALGADIALRLRASDFTGAKILERLITVDGAGSALDADLLDGYHGADYDRVVQRSLVENGGFEVFASGKKETWGRFQIAENAYVTFNLPTPHTSWVHPVLGVSTVGGNTSIQDNTGITEIVTDAEGRPTGVRIWNADDRTVTVWIRTKGV